MAGFIEWLKGKKTYVAGFLIAVATFAHNVGWIGPETYQQILGFLGALGLIALRAGINK